jgi:hypothetical protein
MGHRPDNMTNDDRQNRDRLASLVEEERPRLAQMLGSTSFEIEERRGGHCSIAGSTLTLNIYRRPKSEVIDSSIELHSLPSDPMKLSHQLHTWFILKSRGEPWPEPSTGTARQLLGDELDRASRALKVVADKQMLLEALLWEAGYRNGWLAWG